MAKSRPLFPYFLLLLTVNSKQVCQWFASNPVPLVSEAIALPTVPQPLHCVCSYIPLIVTSNPATVGRN